MSRPQDLPAALQAWAKANYAAGPAWGGAPQRVTPAGSALVPGVSAPADVLNFLHGNAFDAAQGAVNAVGQLPALNWFPSVAVTAIAFGWSDFEQAWYAIQTSSTALQRSMDFGRAWGALALPVATSASATGTDIAFDPSGNAVVCTGGAVESGACTGVGSVTWTNYAGVLQVVAPVSAQVVYEPVSATWCCLQSNSGSGMFGQTSINRSTWTARTLASASWTTYAIPGMVQMGVGNGVIIAAFVDTNTTFRTMRSTNGGVTWANDQAITVNAGIALVSSGNTANSTGISRPVWSSVDALWYIAAFQTAGSAKTQIFSSPDGITWSSAATLLTNDVAFYSLACLGSLLVGMKYDGTNTTRISASWNKGVNWYRCGSVSVGNAFRMLAGGNGLMVMGSTAASPSARFGLPVTAV